MSEADRELKKLKDELFVVQKSELDFNDAIGLEKECLPLAPMVRYFREFNLLNKQSYRASQGIPKGCILIGSPGCGKTRMGRCLAGHCDVNLIVLPGATIS